MVILVVNAGSSTLKSQIIETDDKTCLMKALAEKIGDDDAFMNVSFFERTGSFDDAGKKETRPLEKKTYDVAGMSVDQVLDKLLDLIDADPASPVASLADIDAIGNRVVAGGEYFSASTIIDDDAFGKIQKCEVLAPLHNPPAEACIELLRKRLPDTPQVAVFDTAFHQSMPPKAYMYPLPMRFYEQNSIRRYGAHGTSHSYAAQQAAKLLGRKVEDLGIITCHLGSGGSIAAVNHGQSVDTTMGFTPLEGIMMGTRSGTIDPAIVTFIMRQEGIDHDEMDRILNKESGLLGISGVSNDMREVQQAADDGDERAKLAIDMYVYKIQKSIGSFYAVMNRTDAIVMTAGIGENSVELREEIFNGLAHMGMIIDKDKNRDPETRGMNRVISVDDSPVKICVVLTDEEMRIADETEALVSF